MSRSARLARGWAIGSVATLVAAVSHTVAAGSAPSALAVALGTVFAGLVGTAAVGRRAGFVRTSLIVVISQLAFHLGFALLSTGPASTVSSGAHHHVVTLTTAGSPTAHVHTDPAMWIAHAIAAALTIAYLLRVERSVWAVLESAGRRLLSRITVNADPLPVATALLTAASDLRASQRSVLADVIARRGPPTLLSF